MEIIESLKQTKDQIPEMTVVEESLAEIWDNKEDERWNDY